MKYLSALLTLGLLLMVSGKWAQNAIAVNPPLYMSQASSALQGNWKLVGWGDPENLTPVVDGTEITANIAGDRISGSGGCNNYNGSYEASGNTLTFGPIASTRRACPPPIMTQEDQYFTALNNGQTFEITDQGDLLISYQTDEGTGVLRFARQVIPALW